MHVKRVIFVKHESYLCRSVGTQSAGSWVRSCQAVDDLFILFLISFACLFQLTPNQY